MNKNEIDDIVWWIK